MVEPQKQYLDSLNHVIEDNSVHDTTRIEAYIKIAEVLNMVNMDTIIPLNTLIIQIIESELSENPNKNVERTLKSAKATAFNNFAIYHMNQGHISETKKYLKEVLKIFIEIDDKEGLADTYLNIGILHYNIGEPDEAQRQYELAIKAANEISYLSGIAKAKYCLAVVFKKKGDFLNALDNYNESMDAFDKLRDKQGIAQVFSGIASIYQTQDDVPRAIELHRKALNLYLMADFKYGVAESYLSLSGLYLELEELDSALTLSFRSLQLREEIGFLQGVSECYTRIGAVHSKQEAPDSAIYYYGESKAIDFKLGYKKGVAGSLISIGREEFKLGKLTQATKTINEGFELANQLGYINEIKESARLLYLIEKTLGNSQVALDMYELYISMRDSIMNEENQRETIRTEFRHENELMEKENQLLLVKVSTRNRTLVGIGIIVFLLIVISVALVIGLKRDRKRHAAEVRSLLSDIELFKMKRNQLEGGILKPSVDYLDFDVLNAEIEDELVENDMAVIRVWFEEYALSRKETAERLFIGEDALKDRIKKIRDKLGVSGKEAIVKRIMEILGSK